LRAFNFAIMSVFLGLSGAVKAQEANPLPQGTVVFVVPLAAGGPLDAAARLYAERLSPRIGRTIIVENKSGAGGNIGAAFVAKAAPDGLTWLYTIDSVLTVNPHLYASQGFVPDKDLIPAARIGHNLLVLAVNAKKVPAKTFAELVTFGKTNDLNFASAGIGSPGHLAFEYLRLTTGLRAVHVPYRGAAPALTDIASGAVEAGFVTGGVIIPHVATGVLRPLATSGSERSAQLPDVPTADEAGIKGFEARFGNYILSPGGTDQKIRDFMARHIAQIIQQSDVKERMMTLATEPVFGDQADSIARIAADREKWGKVIAAAKLKVE
jgi:tripartite-type tricarboxylate transporter receptor subunit TctC